MDELSAIFAALADPTRRAILARLAQGETHVGDLASPFRISAPAVSRHLRVLERAGLVERKVSAQWRVCRLRGAPLSAAHDWLSRYRDYWDASLDRLANMLEQPPAAERPDSRSPPAPRSPRSTRSPRSKRKSR
jgi:DNA-binding transcriptional ArsR family regulator